LATIRPPRVVTCFCCGEELSSAMRGEDPWKSPGDGLRFSADGTFGSSFFDSLVEGEGVALQLVICDQCLTNNESRTRRVRYSHVITEETIGDIVDAVSEDIEDAVAEGLKGELEEQEDEDTEA